jgi:hypothetical protein
MPTNHHMLGILEAESFMPLGSVQQLGYDLSPSIKKPNNFVTNLSQKIITKRDVKKSKGSRNDSYQQRRLSPFNSFPMELENKTSVSKRFFMQN